MLNAKIGADTLEILSIAGALRDLMDQYVAIHERLYTGICKDHGMPDSEYEKLYNAFSPAISFIEDLAIERFQDFASERSLTEM